MGTTGSIEAGLAAPAVVAGSTELTINRFDKKQALASAGQFRRITQQAGAAVQFQNAKSLSALSDLPCNLRMISDATSAIKRPQSQCFRRDC
jgi:hypothetical protein